MHSIPAHEFFGHPVTERVIRPAAGWVCGWSRWTGAGLLLASLAMQDAWGLALGQARIQSAIGEPLQASIDLPALSAEEAETLQISVANAAAFQAAGLDYKPTLSSLVLQVERGADGQARLSLRGQQAFNDTYLDLLLQANWKGGQLTRRYSLLLSPASSQPAATGLQTVASAMPAPQPAVGIPLPPSRPAPEASSSGPGRTIPRQAQAKTAPAQQQAPALTAAPAPAMASAAVTPAAPAQVEPQPAPVAATKQQPPEPEKPGTPRTAASSDTGTAPVTPPPPPRQPNAAPAPVEPASSSWPDRLLQPAWLGVAALLLAGLAGLLAWQRRRQPEIHVQAPADISIQPPATASEDRTVVMTQAAAVVAAPVQESGAAGTQAGDDAEIDPIAEADVYLAYGRVQQAEEILREAVHHHPDSLAPRLKLLEIAVQRGDRPACTSLLPTIAVLTGHAGPDWDRANELLGQLPPELPASSPAEPSDQPVVQDASTSSATPLELDLGLAAAPSAPAEPAPASAQQADEIPRAQDQGLDFDIDLSEISRTAPRAATVAAETIPAASAAAPRHDRVLDFEPEPEIASDPLSDLLVKEDNSEPDPLATQLELAEEFLALGDAEGARPLAERVQALATGELQSRARALLRQLDAGPH